MSAIIDSLTSVVIIEFGRKTIQLKLIGHYTLSKLN